MIKTENFAKVEVKSAADLRRWLQKNWSTTDSVWLVTYKKHVADKYVSVDEVLDELICFGWIDGIRRKLDEDKTMQLISPRRVQHWSRTYKQRYARLVEEGRMAAPGLASVQRAKQSGHWNDMEDVDDLVKPANFLKALRQFPASDVNFNTLAPSAQRFTLRWIKLAKTPATRQRRIQQAARLASEGKKIPGI